jgi:hypothetical protein
MLEIPRKGSDFGGRKIEKGAPDLTMEELIKKLKKGEASGKISEEDIAKMKVLQNPEEFRKKIGLLLKKIEGKTEKGDK